MIERRVGVGVFYKLAVWGTWGGRLDSCLWTWLSLVEWEESLLRMNTSWRLLPLQTPSRAHRLRMEAPPRAQKLHRCGRSRGT